MRRAQAQAQLLPREADQAARDGVVQRGEDLRHLLRAHARGQQQLEQSRHLPADGDQPLQRRCLLDLGREIERVLRLQGHQVAGGHHADHPLVARQRKVVDAASRHREDSLQHRARRVERERLRGHDGGHRLGRVAPLREHPVAQVAVGDDPADPVAVVDEQRRNAVLRHGARGLGDCRRGRHRDRRAADQLGHGRHEQGLPAEELRGCAAEMSRSSRLRMK